MSASKEDILLSIPHVKNKKCDGSLCLLSERVAWMPTGKSSLTISQYYTDIKGQKISPDTKDKVQLQIVLVSSGAHTFHFNNPEGREAQVRDRDAVKDLLAQMLSKFKKQMNNDLEEKNRMLQEDPHLFQLYKSLVAGGILTADEFWANRTNKPKVGEFSKQEIGVSTGFLGDIDKVVDVGGRIRYNLTVDTIENIFKAFPAVERVHEEYVPDRMTDEEFWVEFFKSHYFHMDRMDFNEKEMFASCMVEDERRLKREQQLALVKNAKGDLQNLLEVLSEEQNNGPTQSKKETLIKRLNQHSLLVLKSADLDKGPEIGRPSLAPSEPIEGTENRKKRKLKEELEEDKPVVGKVLRLNRTDSYRHGPMPVTADTYNTTGELMDAARRFAHDVMAWEPTPPNQLLPNSTAGLNVIWELSPSGSLMQDTSAQQLDEAIPKELLLELKSMYSGLGELLRHFWSCFPITCKELEEKALRMEECLRKFQKTKLPAFSEKMATYHLVADPTSHMNILLEKAFAKYTSWSMKKTAKRI